MGYAYIWPISYYEVLQHLDCDDMHFAGCFHMDLAWYLIKISLVTESLTLAGMVFIKPICLSSTFTLQDNLS